MALTLKQLTDVIAVCEVEYVGETMEVEYRPGVLTPAMVEDIGTARDAQELGECIEELVVSWDLLDGDGNPIAPTAENCANLPMGFVNHVLMALLQDTAPKQQTDALSGGSTRRRGRMKSRTSPNGTAPLKS